MKTIFAYFAAPRYWTSRKKLEEVYDSLTRQVGDMADETLLVTGAEELEQLTGGEDAVLVAVPMSGAVQGNILSAAARYSGVAVYAAYIKGNSRLEYTDLMLSYNAAPTVMDSWSVLRRSHPRPFLALNAAELNRTLRVFAAYRSMQGARLLLIGDIEPWVISASRDFSVYARLGITVQQIPQQEVAELYRGTSPEEGRPYADKFKNGAAGIQEPTDEDLLNAGRMTAALVGILHRYKADGMAIACFNLLAERTSSCLGVSYINDCTDKVAACEGDLDSACTMLMMKRLTATKLWMANPGLQPDGTVNFSHCTAPINVDGSGDRPYILRSHHESGIGASIQVELPLEQALTACRISDSASKITIQRGVGVAGERENCCRTQLHVRLDSFDRYLQTALGCHQVFAFEDIAEELRMLAGLCKLEIL